jgi:sec-independent protein translocase protein TatB
MFGIGMQELMIILLVALVVIGPKKLPEVARTIAKGVRELRRASDDLKATIMVDIDEPYRPPHYDAARSLPERTGNTIERASPSSVADAETDDGDPEAPSPPIAGSAAFGAEGTVSRGGDVHGPDPMDADDHGDMPSYAPGSPELNELLAQAKARSAHIEGGDRDGAEEPEST